MGERLSAPLGSLKSLETLMALGLGVLFWVIINCVIAWINVDPLEISCFAESSSHLFNQLTEHL